MKTLILNGSPHKDGNGMAIISQMCEFLHGEVKIISPYDLAITACRDCRLCQQNQKCVIKDDMEEVYEYLEEADNLIISSPIHLSCLSPPLLALLGRLPHLHRHYKNTQTTMKKKNGVYILTGAGEVLPWGPVEETEMTLTEEKSEINVRDKMAELSDTARLAGKSLKKWLRDTEDKMTDIKEGAAEVSIWLGRMAKSQNEFGLDMTRALESNLHVIFKRLNTKRVAWVNNLSTSFTSAADNPPTMNQAKSAALLLNRLYDTQVQKELNKKEVTREEPRQPIEPVKPIEPKQAKKPVEPIETQEPVQPAKEQLGAKKGLDRRAERERIRMEKQAARERARYR